MYATVITVQTHERDGCLHATSKDMPGLHVCGTDFADVHADVPGILERLYRLNNGMDVHVTAKSAPDFTTEMPNLDTPASFVAVRDTVVA